MVGPSVFLSFLVLLAIERLLELRLSRRNERQMKSMGGVEHAPRQFLVMAALHSLWFVSMIVEVLVAPTSLPAWVTILAGVGFVAGQSLRFAAIKTLGPRWSVRIMVCPAMPLVDGGLYHYIRHPNYLGVVLEIAAVPLLGGAWRSALAFTIANGLMLLVRIRAEERVLTSACGYESKLMDRPRFLPGVRP
jgi:methyltransferase